MSKPKNKPLHKSVRKPMAKPGFPLKVRKNRLLEKARKADHFI